MKKEHKTGTEIEQDVCDYARKAYGMLTFKFNSMGRRGVPDRILITQQGLIMFIEFKATDEEPTTPQLRTIAKLVDYNCEAAWCNDVEKGKALVDLISDADAYWNFCQTSIGPPPVPDTSH